jgi:hypothetical protein
VRVDPVILEAESSSSSQATTDRVRARELIITQELWLFVFVNTNRTLCPSFHCPRITAVTKLGSYTCSSNYYHTNKTSLAIFWPRTHILLYVKESPPNRALPGSCPSHVVASRWLGPTTGISTSAIISGRRRDSRMCHVASDSTEVSLDCRSFTEYAFRNGNVGDW